ncbi:MAG: antibiotic ABC transporter ATP-binding protein [Bacteroidetes bacterium GWF2_43_63]|nr:MAG: antibiotic ABC transporter ATP-binding protein [Bacteroidetes bacterium GWE2_42_42]OFY54145.1 MAG: antibiotic ABC transporter ATP-binding protein [Bacteroidetes bacterium GWF2_43_63]HBG70818.1 antibiotic ABC transporter ATP-binding protein [Bacteroidales bacterium]HCB61722.1 antibiotic ABC transporter ATP-binding protein [Bacteroidales bacterium]HCY22098.1 antibiotic ABC transporter ATP-binding protein [Bacteroidales bacterium]
MKSLRRMLRLINGHWRNTLYYLLFNILTAVFSLFSIAMVIPFLRVLFGMQQRVAESVPFEMNLESLQHNLNYFISNLLDKYGINQTLIFVCIVIVILFFFRNLFTYLSTYFMAPVRNGIVEDLRNKMYRKILHLPMSFFSNERKGDIMSRVTNDVQEVDNSVMSSIQVLFKDPIFIVIYLSSLFLMNYRLTLIILLMLPVIGFVLGVISRSLRKKAKLGQQRLGFLTSLIDETLHGLRIIKAFTAEEIVYKNTAESNHNYTRLQIRIFRKRNLASPLTEFFSILVMAIILFLGANMVLTDGLAFSAEAFIAYIMLFSQLLPPAKSFSNAWSSVQKGMASLERVDELLDADEVILDPENPAEFKGFNHSVEFSNVSFTYGNDNVLHNINLTIPKGKTIALVGASGAGKTTMVDLLPRFFDVTEGEILIDNVPIKNYNVLELRSLFGIVNQEPILFNDTFFNNISFGKPNASREEVENAARIANAHDFIMETPEGYDTSMGERGSKLSGGQRQRISIARAVLKNPPILILDEATSSLDSENERMVQDALDRLLSDRTSVVIAHRLSTIVKADNIVVLDQGRIVEQGKHEELLALGGQYKHLYDLQMFGKK